MNPSWRKKSLERQLRVLGFPKKAGSPADPQVKWGSLKGTSKYVAGLVKGKRKTPKRYRSGDFEPVSGEIGFMNQLVD